MLLLDTSFAIAEKHLNWFDKLVYLRSIIDSANTQLKKIHSEDKALNKVTKKIIALNDAHLVELDRDLLKITIGSVSNVVSVINVHNDAFENSLHLLTLVVNNYRSLLDDPTINFTVRKKLQAQLNKLLYDCLQLKLLRLNPGKVPYNNVGQLF